MRKCFISVKKKKKFLFLLPSGSKGSMTHWLREEIGKSLIWFDWVGFHRGNTGSQNITRTPKNSGNCASWEVKFNCTCTQRKKLSKYQAYFWFANRTAIPQAPPSLISSAVSKTSALLARISLLLSFIHSASTPVSQPLPPHLPAVPRFLSPDAHDTKER